MPPAAPRRAGRLSSLKGPPPTRGRPRAPAKAADAVKKCPSCGLTDLEEIDGSIVCKDCYTLVSDANIVAEVTFEESAGGRATVQGSTVNENARHAKTLGPAAFRRVGGGERTTLTDIQAAGRRALAGICPRLAVEGHVQEQADAIYTLATNINFSAGRKTDEVVAACLYAACRRQKDNQILLMDIAELLQINVFRLGEVYKDMCKELMMTGESVGHQHLQELEPLIKKYCDKLQFAEQTKQVAQDALRIIRRMNRDWIVAGRHPAGLCGACIILAARMNNFQRSVREVVYVSKVADVTIAKRVEEFRRTKSSALSVDEFRKKALRIRSQHDPPSFNNDEKERLFNNRKRKRDEHVRLTTIARESREREERESQEAESQDAESQQARSKKPQSKQPQVSDERESQREQSQQPQGITEIPDDATDASSRLSSVESDLPPSEEVRPQKRPRLDIPAGSPQQSPSQSQSPAPASSEVPAPSEESAPSQVPAPSEDSAPSGASLPSGQPESLQPTPPATQDSSKRKRNDGEDTASDAPREDAAQNKRQRTDGTLPAGNAPAQPESLQPTPPATQDSSKRKRDDGEDTASDASREDAAQNKRQRTDGTPPAGNAPAQPERRIDSDGFAIPALPASATAMGPNVPPVAGPSDSTAADGPPDTVGDHQPKRRGRRKKEEQAPQIDLSKEELIMENYLELEIEKYLEDGEVQESQSEVEAKKTEERLQLELERAKVLADEQRKLVSEKHQERRAAFGQAVGEEENLEKLFEHDMEVAHCMLGPEEVKIKEQIWVAHNEDWLRKQAEKEMMAALAKKNGTEPRKRGGKNADKPGKRRKKHSKMGDGTVLTEASTPVETPADAARLMMEKRAPQKSHFVDFSALERIYQRDTPSQSGSSPNRSGSQTRQVTPLDNSRQGTPASSRPASMTPAPSEPATESDAQDGASPPAAASSPSDEEVQEEETEEAEAPAQDETQDYWDNFNKNPVVDQDAEEGEEAYDNIVEQLNEGQDEFGAVEDEYSGSEYEYE